MSIFRFICMQSTLFMLASSVYLASLEPNFSERDAVEILKGIHAQSSLLYGSFNEEYPEQILSVMFISPDDRVLEIGGNIGRNSCVIGSLLSDSANLLVLESDPGSASALMENRDLNQLSFQVENAAISHVPLIQAGWITVPDTKAPPGYFQVNTITYDELKEKYPISFNVLVADCEGALYYIFQDDESILEDVELIIVENDYYHRAHYETVSAKFIAHGFELAYNKIGGWGPCYYEFYQVWKKP